MKIVHEQPLLFLGSCFSDEISFRAKNAGFQVNANPFGTIFHPLALSRFINESILAIDCEERIIERNELFFSLDASSTIYASSSNELISELKQIRENWVLKLKAASHLFITFGTAWLYELTVDKTFVANCHKLPGSYFQKRLVLSDELVNHWKTTLDNIRRINPEIQVVFTVSPVRHAKDGLIENNQSKAQLIDAVRQLANLESSNYFPSYEIVIDELRDYRFYKKDRLHPSDEAIDYVWQRFEETFCTEETRTLSNEVRQLKSAMHHKSIHPESTETKAHKKRVEEQRTKFEASYPYIVLD